MEYFRLGDLYKYLDQANSAPCTEEDGKQIANQLLHGLKIMHGLGFAHRDIKPQVSKSSHSNIISQEGEKLMQDPQPRTSL
jgi:serine/threonine protein kinase